MCITSVLITIPAHVPSHTEELVSGTTDSEGVETTPEIVSHSLLIALHAVNKWWILHSCLHVARGIVFH